jgi:REP element-mobilizing transposase RayT
MSQSLASVLIHLVFSTKQREPLIVPEFERELYAYMGSLFRDLRCPLLIGNGTEDHVHLLFSMARTVTIADVVEEVKKNSSRWFKTKADSLQGFQWQAGYGAFSVSRSMLDPVRAYITNQKEHHRTRSFQDEYRQLLQLNGIEYDERYVWD